MATHKCIGVGCTFCLQERIMFQENRTRYDKLLTKYGFTLAQGWTTPDRAVWSHENGWAVELRANRSWRLIDPSPKTVRSDEYLNDLESALDNRIQKGIFLK